MAQGITNKTKLLVSSIEIPDDAVLYYAIYSSASPDPVAALETSRRKLSGTTPEDDLLAHPVSRIHFEDGKPVLYVFHLLGPDDDAPGTQLDDLTRTAANKIDIPLAVSARMLCPENHGPCTCSHSKPALDQATKDSQLAQALFLDSLRDRLIDEICAKSTGRGHIPAVRLKNGFCLIDSRKSTEWTEKWAKNVNNGLIFCEIQLHLTATHILVQPLPRRITAISPLVPSLVVQGSAILLLPHGIPAFYLGAHTADERTACEFAESISSSSTHQSVSKDFAKCYVPFRRINDRQDGGITTIWPRSHILANPTRASLSTQSYNSSAPPSAVQKAAKGITGEMHTALSLTSLSLHSSPSLDALSTAMGIYVDASMKDRDRPARQNSAQTSSTSPQQTRPQQSITGQNLADLPVQASTSSLQAPSGLASQLVPEPLPESIQPPVAQSYPSPLELLNQTQPQPAPSVSIPPPSAPTTTEVPNPAPAPVDDPPPAQVQPNFASQQMPMDSWDFGSGSFGGGGSFGANNGFGLGGDTEMFGDPFSAAMFTEDDFNFLNVPTVPATTSAALADHSHVGEAGGLGDVTMDFSSAAHGDPNAFVKLETGMLDWNLEFGSTAPASIGVTNPTIDDAAQLQQLFGIEGLEADLPSSLLGPKTPGLPIDAPSIQIRLDSDSPMNVDRDGSEEIADDETPTASEGFLALRFGKEIGLADEKYTSGKYSLPSPPPDDPSPLSRSPQPPRRMKSVPAIWPISAKEGTWMHEPRPLLSRMNSARPALSRANTTTPTGPWKSSTAREGDLRSRYMAATHPSTAMLYKLAGTKRPWEVPLPTTPKGSSDKLEADKEDDPTESPAKKRRLTWSATGEEWRNPTPPMEESEEEGDDDDSSVGGEDGWNEGMDLIGIDAIDPFLSSGSYKSDGPTRFENPIKLLNAQFDTLWIAEHDLVSPTDLALPPPGTNVPLATAIMSRRSSVPPVPVSVPTPVSPEALIGGNDGSSRLTAAVAQQFAQEIGKNALWNAVVSAMRAFRPGGLKASGVDPSQVDVTIALDALKATKVEWGRSIEDFADTNEYLAPVTPVSPEKDGSDTSEYVQTFQSPKVYLGHGTNVIEALPTIVRFWNQLNVTPLNGPKDVHAVALLSDTGGNPQVLQAELWLEKLGKEYAAKRFGTHIVAQLQKNPKGVASIRWDNFRSVCERLVLAAKDSLSLPLIVYVIVPNSFANLSHPSAAQVLSTISEINDTLANCPGKLVFHLIPEVFVSHSRSLSHNSDFGLDRLALSVYDSVPRIVEREHSRLSVRTCSVRESVHAPAFVLASSRSAKAVFVEKWPPPTANILDRYAFLHVAYAVSPDGEWVAASVVTETGDEQESRTWKTEDVEPALSLVKNVLEFTLNVASKADVEWRITVSKNGVMSTPEFEAWTAELAARVELVKQSMHLTLLSVTSGESPIFMTTPQLEQLSAAPLVAARSSGAKDSTVFVDSSSGTFLVFPKPVGMTTSSIDLFIQADFLSFEVEEHKSDPLSMTPISTCWLVDVSRRPEWTPRQHDSLPISDSTTSGCQIHALHLVRFGNSSYAGDTEEHMRNISKSFYDLMILNEMRRGTLARGVTFRQPLHLALVDSVAAALGSLQV